MYRVRFLSLIMSGLMLFSLYSCKEETVLEEPEIAIPPTYSFDNVDFGGQTTRLIQLQEMVAYIETANQGAMLSKDVLMSMWENEGGNGNGNFSNTSDKRLSDKCFGPDVATIEDLFDQMVEVSENNTQASQGVAGVMVSEDGSEARMFDENGHEFAEVFEKMVMGAVFYYQATAVYLSDEKMDVDNELVTEGKGTEMEHHWDEAYGYLGVSTDFPEDTEGTMYWGKYCNSRNALLGTNESLSGAFRRGRSGIHFKDYELRDVSITEVRAEWEKVCAATAIHYLNAAINNMSDDMYRNHVLSEGVAFIQNLTYNPERSVTLTQIDEMIGQIGVDYYAVSADDLKSVRDQLASIYGLEDLKAQL